MELSKNMVINNRVGVKIGEGEYGEHWHCR